MAEIQILSFWEVLEPTMALVIGLSLVMYFQRGDVNHFSKLFRIKRISTKEAHVQQGIAFWTGCQGTSVLRVLFFFPKVRASSLKFHDSIMENMCKIKRRKIVWGCLFCLGWQTMLTAEYHCTPKTCLRGKFMPKKMVAITPFRAFSGTTFVSKCVSELKLRPWRTGRTGLTGPGSCSWCYAGTPKSKRGHEMGNHNGALSLS